MVTKELKLQWVIETAKNKPNPKIKEFVEKYTVLEQKPLWEFYSFLNNNFPEITKHLIDKKGE